MLYEVITSVIEIIAGDVLPDIDARFKYDAFLHHQCNSPVNHAFLEFEIRDSIPEYPAWFLAPFINGHVVAGPVKGIGRGKS